MSDEKYCIECGEAEDIAFIGTSPSGDRWKCRTCGTGFHWTVKGDDQ